MTVGHEDGKWLKGLGYIYAAFRDYCRIIRVAWTSICVGDLSLLVVVLIVKLHVATVCNLVHMLNKIHQQINLVSWNPL